MPLTPDELHRLATRASTTGQYDQQLERVSGIPQQIDCIQKAVENATKNLADAQRGSLVVYGDPQSGKTEMMICLTARLQDMGYRVIVHLMNDSVDLLAQNLDRFRLARLAPAPRNAVELAGIQLLPEQSAVVFCKKNKNNLRSLITSLENIPSVVVIDDEADYATPNSKVNRQQLSRINELVTQLVGTQGKYIGVTATPARLNLNNTLNNKVRDWVRFPSHAAYTGQDTFFPRNQVVAYRLVLLPGIGTREDLEQAFLRFLVTVAHLNTRGADERNFTFLVHTSGKKGDHVVDRGVVDEILLALSARTEPRVHALVRALAQEAEVLYPSDDASRLVTYVLDNITRNTVIVLNSERDRGSAGDSPTAPKCPFTVIVGGNIVSRGVTFPNLLSMFFTRDVGGKLQQDTYIQRARMFGARGGYLPHFELTIPTQLYADWHRCFVFHRLALESIERTHRAPVWIEDPRIAATAGTSVDLNTVNISQGEMGFLVFDCPDPGQLDQIILVAPTEIETLERLGAAVGDGLPQFLVDYLKVALEAEPGTLAIHVCGSIATYKGADTNKDEISRRRGFIGTPQLQLGVYPNARHHIKIFHNGRGKARLFYKSLSGTQFVQNLAG